MKDGIRCPYCNKKLLESLHGNASIRCRHCKHLVSVVGEDFDHNEEMSKLLAAVGSPVTTRKLDNGQYEHTIEFSGVGHGNNLYVRDR